jgi:hypothetical protein
LLPSGDNADGDFLESHRLAFTPVKQAGEGGSAGRADRSTSSTTRFTCILVLVGTTRSAAAWTFGDGVPGRRFGGR